MDQRDAPSGGSGDSAGHQRGAPSRGSGGGAAHHAVFAIEDVLGHALSYLSFPRDLTSAEVSRAWRRAWHATATGLLRPLRRVDGLSNTTHVAARDGGGVVVINRDCENQTAICLLSARGDLETTVESPTSHDTSPGSVILLGDGTAWVIHPAGGRLIRLRLDDGELLVDNDISDATYNAALRHSRNYPTTLALADDALLVLRRISGVEKRCASTGNLLSTFAEGLVYPTDLAVAGDLIYISERATHFNPFGVWRMSVLGLPFGEMPDGYVHVFSLAAETCLRKFGDETSSVRFKMPMGVAVADGRLYVATSDWERGSQIQVLRLPEGEVLQIIPSPTTSDNPAIAEEYRSSVPHDPPLPWGDFVGGLCVDRGRLWAIGPEVSVTYVRILVPYPQLLG